MMQASFFQRNRQQFAEKLAGGIAVIPAYTQMQRKNDAAFQFEQESNFLWLSGIKASDWWLIIDARYNKSWIASPTISQSHQIFDGSLSAERAQQQSGVDAVITHDEAMDLLRSLAKTHSVVNTLGEQPYAEYLDFTLNPANKKIHDMLTRMFVSVHDCRKDLAQLRAIKHPEEIAVMRRAIKLTTEAFGHVKSHLAEYRYEYEVEADFSHYFRSKGADGHAYDPIVAAGQNACTLHYIDNQSKLKKNELLLLDVGAQVDGYAADVTRTYSLGTSTRRQHAVHNALQQAQSQIVNLLRPHLLVEEYHQNVETIMKDALLSLGLMKDRDDTDNYHKYFPHAISHGLGLDVHDSLGAPASFESGMVLTVEPGIYIPEEGIGIRIEDDILITQTGHDNLSAKLSTDL